MGDTNPICKLRMPPPSLVPAPIYLHTPSPWLAPLLQQLGMTPTDTPLNETRWGIWDQGIDQQIPDEPPLALHWIACLKRPTRVPWATAILLKPYHPKQLIRVLGQAIAHHPPRQIYTIADGWLLHTYLATLTSPQNDVIMLTEKECLLLQTLAKANGAMVSRETLLEQVWHYHADADSHTVETHIYRLRQKLGKNTHLILSDKLGYGLVDSAH
jgi:hypothetical protein